MERINTVNSGQNRVVLTPVKESFAKRSFDKLPNFAKVGLAVAIGATALYGCSGATEKSASANHISTAEAKSNCGSFTDANSASDSSKYNSDSFLPKGNLTSNTSALSYVYNLFDKNGPLAGKGDLGSLAAIDAVLTVPAQKGISSPNSYSYQDQFATSIASFSSSAGGEQAQKTACKNAFTTMTDDANWNNNWAGKGLVVTEFTPTRDPANNNIKTSNGTDLKMEKVTLTGPLHGVEFKSRIDSQKGFNSVLITNQGNIFVQGVISLEGSAGKQDSKGSTVYIQPNGTKVTVTVAPNGEKIVTTENANGTTTSTTIASGSGSGGSGNGNGGGGSGSGGSGNGNGGGTTTTTSPEGTTTTTTNPPETTTTTSPHPTTTTTTSPPTTTTTQPKGTPPGCTPNPPYVIC